MRLPADSNIKTSKTAIYHLTYDAAGGTGHMNTEEFYVESGATASFTLPECGFTAPRGKIFEKWSIGNPGDIISVSSDMTAVAQWKNDPSIAVTESVTEQSSEVVTEIVTNPTTEIETKTEKPTENVTVKKTETVTKATVKEEIKSSDQSEEPLTNTSSSLPNDNGNKYIVGFMILVITFIILIIIIVLILRRKKKESPDKK